MTSSKKGEGYTLLAINLEHYLDAVPLILAENHRLPTLYQELHNEGLNLMNEYRSMRRAMPSWDSARDRYLGLFQHYQSCFMQKFRNENKNNSEMFKKELDEFGKREIQLN